MARVEGVPLQTPVDLPGSSRGAVLGKRLLSTLILLPVFVWILLGTPAWVFGAMVILVGTLGQWEFTRMFERAGVRTLAGVGLLGGAAVTASFAAGGAVPAVLGGVVLAVLTAALRRPRGAPAAWEPAAVTLLGICYVNWLLGHALWLRDLGEGADWVLLLVWVTWIGETAAYVVGSCLGRHKLAPVTSPRKTVEGAVAQLAVSPLAVLLAQAWFMPSLTGRDVVLVGLLLGVAGQVGDLVESALKRSVGTKDTGGIIPGHGGILDRLDGLLFNAPVLFYYVSWARAVGA
jgi:phosphatidate cytidylyltransferase